MTNWDYVDRDEAIEMLIGLTDMESENHSLKNLLTRIKEIAIEETRLGKMHGVTWKWTQDVIELCDKGLSGEA